MEQAIVGYQRDDADHWVAELACGHFQHVRHHPPLMTRPWVQSEEGRQRMLGSVLDCRRCDESGTGSLDNSSGSSTQDR